MRMRKKKNLLPRMERCGEQLIRDPYERAGHWHELMPQAKEIRLELGCGKGRFTAGTAAAEPDVLFIAVERVPDAMVVAMERCVNAGLTNVFFVDANADQLPYFFAPGEIARIYVNFCDPWPSKRHAKRRLIHGNFLRLYRQVLRDGGQIHFKTDNHDLFEFSVEEIPQFGFILSEVTRNLHENGPVGIMTDYEAKFYDQGMPINRLVATMQPWEEPFPTNLERLQDRWLDAFAPDLSEADLGKYVLADSGNLWHVFSEKLVPALEGEDARQALQAENTMRAYRFSENDGSVKHVPGIDPGDVDGLGDLFVVDQDFTWTYIHIHDDLCGPYFCRACKE